MQTKQEQPNKPKIQYRVELEKRIEINRSYKQRRNQAIALRILSYSLFGKKRYQNIYLTCSLNCLYFALRIANTIHSRVAGLAMIVKFQHLDVIEYYSEQFEGKSYANKKYSRIVIKLTRNPSQEDKKQPGYNAGLDAADIKVPLTEVMGASRNQDRNFNRNQKQYKENRYNRDNRDNHYNRDNRDNRDNKNYRDYKDRNGGRNENKNQDRRPQRRYRDQEEVKPSSNYRNKKYVDENDNKKVTQNPANSQLIRGATKSRGGSHNVGTRDERGSRQPRERNEDDD